MMLSCSSLPLFALMAGGLASPLVARDCSFSAYADDGDTCASLGAAWGITEAQFKSYNPNVNDCSALKSGSLYCVQWSGALPGATTTTTSKTTSPAPTSSNDFPSPTQPGATSKCTKWVQQSGDNYCADMAAANGVSLSDFLKWNNIDDDCSNLIAGDYECVAVNGSGDATTTTSNDFPSPTQPGATSNCTKWVQQMDDNYCADIAAANGISLSDFLKWNNIDDKCSNLIAGDYECVAVSGGSATTTTKPTTTTSSLPGHGTEPGTISTCKKFHLVKSGDTCAGIEKKYSITDQQFRKWNTELNDACTNIWLDYDVCVGV